jgi:hypothetical protein
MSARALAVRQRVQTGPMPSLTLNAALTAKSAGDDFWVSEDHAETTAGTITHTSPGTAGTPCRVLCALHTGSVPPVSADLRTTATISTTGASNINFAGIAYCYGITFSAGSLGNSAGIRFSPTNSSEFWRFDTCSFTLNNTNAGAAFSFGIGSTGLTGLDYSFTDCRWTFGSNTGQGFTCSASVADVDITGGSIVVGANVPATLFKSPPANLLLRGVDLSALGSGKTLVGANGISCRAIMQDCRLGASVTVAATPTTLNQEVYLFRSDSGATNYRNEKYHYAGTETTETTIVRTSPAGASDGTTPWSKKIVTTGNAKRYLPFECIPFDVWVDSTGSHTITAYGIWGSGSVPTTAQMGMDIEYLGNGSYPLASFDRSTSAADPLAAGGNHSSDTSTWGGSTTAFKMVSGSFTVNQKGWVRVYIKVYAASTTVYFDQKVDVG